MGDLVRCPSCGRALEPVPPGAGGERNCPECGPTSPSTRPAAAQGAADPSREGDSTGTDSPESDTRPSPEATRRAGAPAGFVGAAPRPFPEGIPFGRYRLIERLGAGAMGIVWRAWDDALGREVALKQVRFPERAGADTRARFRREARLISRLRHPHIAAVHDVGVQDGADYFTMELVRGRPLSEVLAEARSASPSGRMQGDALRRSVEQLANIVEAVAAAHAHGVVHRDLKPSNVLIDDTGAPRVVDFGLARSTEPEPDSGALQTGTGEILGTPAYMSPEQASAGGIPVGPAGDQYALGTILFEMLTGRLPFEGETAWAVIAAKAREEAVSRPGLWAPDVPPDLEAACLRALERDPGRRYPSTGALAEDLRRWLRGEAVRVRRVGRLELGLRALERKKGILALALAAVLVPALVAVWAHRSREASRRGMLEFLRKAAAGTAELEDRLLRVEATPEVRRTYAEFSLALIRDRLSEEPQDPAALAWRGRVHGLLGRVEEAARDLDAACAADDGTAVAWYLRGLWRLERYAARRGFPLAAWGPFGVRILETGPESAEETGLREGGLSDLGEAVRRGGDLGPLDGEQRRLAGAMASLHGPGAEGAARALEQLEGLDLPRAWHLRGQALYRLARFEESVEAFGRVLALWPMEPAARLARATARHAVGLQRQAGGEDPTPDYTAAIEDLDLILLRHPGDGRVLLDRGVIRASLGIAMQARGGDPRMLWSEALEDLDLAVEQQPGSALAHARRAGLRFHLAQAQAERGMDAGELIFGAQADYDAARRLGAVEPGMALDRANVALALARRAEARGEDPGEFYVRAETELGESARVRPDFYAIYYNRALVRTGLAGVEARGGKDSRPRLRGALEDLNEALRLAPERVEVREERALAYRRLGLAEEARGQSGAEWFRAGVEDLDALLERRPGAPTARMHRGLLLHHLGDALRRAGEDPGPAWGRAMADLEEVLRKDPRQADALVFRAGIRQTLAERERSAGREARELLRAAAADYDAAIAVRPDAPLVRAARARVRMALAEAEVRAGRDPRVPLRDTIADLSRDLERNPADSEARARRAWAWEALGDAEKSRGADPGRSYAAAAADCAEILRRTPRDAAAALRRARCAAHLADLDEKGGLEPLPRLEEAAAALTAALPDDHRDPELLSWRGRLRRRIAVRHEAARRPAEEIYRDAVADLTAALTQRPDDPAGRFERGEASIRLGRLRALRGEDATETFATAEADLSAAAVAGTSLAHFALARLYEGLGRWDDAIRAYEAGAVALPNTAEFVRDRIEACRRHRDGGRR